MKPEELPHGTQVAIDANVLIYHFTGKSEQCRQVLSRCQGGELRGTCISHVALECLHRLMMVEAVSLGLVGSNPARRLSESPDKVKGLRSCFASFELLESFGIKIAGLSPKAAGRTPWWSVQYGLLANDAGQLAAMEDHGLFHLVTADRQFLNVSQIRTWLIDDVLTH
ncbi:type II toxin-antitoxin system VapC family toxin [bacterium]|nr:type II toxin-antitoxin system VapC family toxin [bacterium]